MVEYRVSYQDETPEARCDKRYQQGGSNDDSKFHAWLSTDGDLKECELFASAQRVTKIFMNPL